MVSCSCSCRLLELQLELELELELGLRLAHATVNANAWQRDSNGGSSLNRKLEVCGKTRRDVTFPLRQNVKMQPTATETATATATATAANRVMKANKGQQFVQKEQQQHQQATIFEINSSPEVN